MKRVIFKLDEFVEDVNTALQEFGRGARVELLRHTGIAPSTFRRLTSGTCRDIETILSIALYLGLSPQKYLIDTSKRKRDFIFVQ